MTGLVHSWLSVWLWVATATGIAFTAFIIRKWNTWGWGDRLAALTAVWIVPHVWEEWVIPGGFHYIYNTISGSAAPDRYPMNELTDMITNFGVLILGVAAVMRWGGRASVAIAAMLFCAVEVVAHTLSISSSLNAFGSRGQTAWYDPGLVTALLGYLPLFIGFVVYFVRNKPRPNGRHWLAGVAMLGVLLVTIWGPEALLKDPQSPYPFPNHGYYGQFVAK
ncbi:hypothetical protein GQ57_31100 [Burkholderia sp. MSh2]|uniref:HXXEE domain-containing protein n=1 Tax=Burkholderia paludis TaxID=1506587 RepID=A0A6P2R6K1_9BURK|nr:MULTISPECIES: HXXEE domain-containing protein [Burkholderia]KEZ02202.1 hypothetical protein GQ57_31100 [Burkholderia sp. MSh2]CAB3771539.1 hypothetical protein LMG30113_06490 [Burkholderia paludis]VWC28439.1 hypothetical protein BPA30113_06142 [Burkholderia paludis]